MRLYQCSLRNIFNDFIYDNIYFLRTSWRVQFLSCVALCTIHSSFLFPPFPAKKLFSCYFFRINFTNSCHYIAFHFQNADFYSCFSSFQYCLRELWTAFRVLCYVINFLVLRFKQIRQWSIWKKSYWQIILSAALG